MGAEYCEFAVRSESVFKKNVSENALKTDAAERFSARNRVNSLF